MYNLHNTSSKTEKRPFGEWMKKTHTHIYIFFIGKKKEIKRVK